MLQKKAELLLAGVEMLQNSSSGGADALPVKVSPKLAGGKGATKEQQICYIPRNNFGATKVSA
jgi:hypothetical protein